MKAPVILYSINSQKDHTKKTLISVFKVIIKKHILANIKPIRDQYYSLLSDVR